MCISVCVEREEERQEERKKWRENLFKNKIQDKMESKYRSQVKDKVLENGSIICPDSPKEQKPSRRRGKTLILVKRSPTVFLKAVTTNDET